MRWGDGSANRLRRPQALSASRFGTGGEEIFLHWNSGVR